MSASQRIDVCVEIGSKRVFASALDWPGWSRSGRDEASALAALLAYAPRYAHVLSSAHIEFQIPADASVFSVKERLPGNASTDFGVPGMAAAADSRPVDAPELARLQAILRACWQALDRTAAAARGKDLQKGPRGGGRDLDAIVRHVIEAEKAYLRQLGASPAKEGAADSAEGLRAARTAILEALASAAQGDIPALGPRGGVRWQPRYFVRRAAWHALDHVWEIEDRMRMTQ
jgi:hypothetical protein